MSLLGCLEAKQARANWDEGFQYVWYQWVLNNAKRVSATNRGPAPSLETALRHLTAEDETCGLVCAAGGVGRGMGDVARGTFLQGARSMLGWRSDARLLELWGLWKSQLVSRSCEDCELKVPSFGLPAEGKRRWCSGCAKGHAGAVRRQSMNNKMCEGC